MAMRKQKRSLFLRRAVRIILSVFFALALVSISSRVTQAENDPFQTELSSTPATSTEIDVTPPSDVSDNLPMMTFPTVTPAVTSTWSPPLSSRPLALSEYDHFYLSRPIGVDSVNWPMPTYLYGYEDSETEYPHSGLDYDAPLHTPILAAAAGKVVFTGYGLALGKGNTEDPYGLAVVIRHNFSYADYEILTVYAHMEKILVSNGQMVAEGEEIGLVGMTGNTSGPHVHFEVRLEKDDIYYIQNPFLWVMPNIDYGVFVGKFTDAYGHYLTARTVNIESLTTGKKWSVKTYAAQDMSNDPNYRENVALGDLPVGSYEVTFYYNYQTYNYTFSIKPGAITFVSFVNKEGFSPGTLEPSEFQAFSTPNPY